MKRCFFQKLIRGMALLGVLGCAAQSLCAQETEPVSNSALAAIKLPQGTLRVNEANVPDEITGALKILIQNGGAGVMQGKTEVLAWTGGNFKKARIPQLKSQIGDALNQSGWTYSEGEVDPATGPYTLVTAVRTLPTRKALLGFWIPAADGLLLAWTEILPDNSAGPAQTPAPSTPAEKPSAAKPATPAQTPAATHPPASGTVFEIGPTQRYVNVMKNAMPPRPTFPALAPKPGFVRGFAKDFKGKPLVGAVIGVRSTSVGGFYSGASAKTDARGYYEIQAPWGVASFYCAGYTIDWGEGRAALGLHPADGETGQFATPQGHVENWVLLPYGIADRDEVADQPQYAGNYYGGSFSIYYSVAFGDDTTNIPPGGDIELTLSPVGPLFDGSKGQTFVFRRHVAEAGASFYVNNIPIGTYRLMARLLQNGQATPLTIKETGPYSGNPYGLEPKEARGSAMLTFRPGGAKAEMATAQRGHWESVDITLYR